MGRLVTLFKLTAGLALVGIGATLQTVILLLLLPSRTWRIRSCIFFERLVGHGGFKLSGCSLELTGKAHLDAARPAIYLVNHTSLLDLFITMMIMPVGVVGIVKKEVIYYPFFGQMYMLTGHLRIDRSNREAAVASMQKLVDIVRRGRLSIFMSPEGTRSRTGRLLPFKKGFVHLARQTGLPVVPIVISGAFKSWEKSRLAVRGVPIGVTVLPAIDTSGWNDRPTEEITAELEALFCAHLPADQLPTDRTAA
jgi:lysophosphatidate acyltransferase